MKNPNLTWKEFGANEVSHSVAHYLVTLRELPASHGYARVTDVADALGVNKSTVSQEMRRLKEREFVLEDKARHLSLTAVGHDVARRVIYNRATLIRFLNGILGVSADQAEIDACKMEHLLSPETGHRLLSLVHLLLSDDDDAKSLVSEFAEGRGDESAEASSEKAAKKTSKSKKSGVATTKQAPSK